MTEINQHVPTAGHTIDTEASLTASGVKKHKRVHISERPYKCEYCEKCFTRKQNLTKHILIHTGERPYKCEYCEKCFIEKQSLTKHIRIHTGESPYTCELSDKSCLIRHRRVHIGERPLVPAQLLRESVQQLREPVHQLKKPVQQLREPVRQLREPVQQLKEPVQQLRESYQGLGEPVKQLRELIQRLEEPAHIQPNQNRQIIGTYTHQQDGIPTVHSAENKIKTNVDNTKVPVFSNEIGIEGIEVVDIKPLLHEKNVNTYSTNPHADDSNGVYNVNMTGIVKSETEFIKIESISYIVADDVQYTKMEPCQSP